MASTFLGLLRTHRFFLIPYLILILICFYFFLNYTQAEIFLYSNSRHSPFFDEFFKLFTILGDGAFAVLVCIVLLFVKYRYAALLALSYALSSIVVQFFKRVFQAPRPLKFFEGQDPIRTIEGYSVHQWNSFPSGHTASAFTLAVVLIYILPFKSKSWIILILAVLAAYSRVYLAQHFLHDVVAGSVLGVFLSFFLIYWLEKQPLFHSSKLDGRLFA